MNAYSWNVIETIFTAALELEPAERRSYLERECGSTPELFDEIMAMLNAHENNSGLDLEQWVIDAEESLFADAEDLIGAFVGPYQLDELIGQGGMGEVYLAHRADDQYEQQVALKLVRRGYDSSHMRRRFKMERQILARLTHPNITQLLSGGVDQAGRLYLVMPYVDGVSITEYCARHRLSITQRLVMFQTVCDAVHHAHSNLIVHRDLKPSNILVTQEGKVQLLDFGIAKLLDEDQNAPAAITQTHMRPMTLEYASPEQIKGEPITTATDVYALGCVLYELLSGNRPYDLQDKSLSDIERIICEYPPIRPSTAISTTYPHSPERTQEPDSSRLKKALRGDLDNIVLKALRKEPARRYNSAAQFAEDIDRYRKGLTVGAQKDSLTYRMQKFVRRNRVPVYFSVLFVASLIGFSLFTLYQGRLVVQERDTALMEKNRSERIIGLLVQLFETANPAVVPGGDTLRVGEFVDRGVEKTLAEVEGDTVLSIQMKHTLGRMYSAKGQYKEGLGLLQDAYRMQEIQFGKYDSTTTGLLDELAVLTWRLGNVDSARVMFDDLLERNRRIFGGEHPRIAKSLVNVSLTTVDKEERRALLEASLAMRRKLLAPNHIDIAANLNQLAIFHHGDGSNKQALELYKESLGILEETLPPSHPNTLAVLGNMSACMGRLGDLDGAISTQQDVIARLNHITPDTSVQVANAWNNLAVLQTQAGAFEEASRGYRHALGLQEVLLGETHSRVSSTMRNLAITLSLQHKHDEALTLIQKALDLTERMIANPEPGSAAYMRAQYAMILLNADQRADALPEIEQAVRMLDQIPNTPRSYLTSTWVTASLVSLETGQLERAEELIIKALALQEKLLDASHPKIARAKSIYARILAQKGKETEALDILKTHFERYDTWPMSNRVQVEKTRQLLERLEARGGNEF